MAADGVRKTVLPRVQRMRFMRADRLMMVPGTNRIIRIPDDPLYGDDGRCCECGEWPGKHAKICTRGGIMRWVGGDTYEVDWTHHTRDAT